MQVYAPDGMGETRPIFRLVFDEDTLESGELSSSGSSSGTSYTISAAASEGGTISPSGSVKVESGGKKTFTISAYSGYKIRDVLVDGKSAGAVSTYTFENVKAAHTIQANFVKTESGESVASAESASAFSDTANHWAEKAIRFVVDRGIFNGTGEGYFSPDAPVTRGMFVTVLGRVYGVDPENYRQISHSDVIAGRYYTPYVAWAAENGIAQGIGDDSFAPDKTITREEVATMFAGYRKFTDIDPVGQETAADAAKTFADQDKISSWAKESVQAMQKAGLIQGDANNRFNPQHPITRGEAAMILARSLGFTN